MLKVDFTAYKNPILAVPCPDCQSKAGQWCKRPSGHKAQDLHKMRGEKADEVFIEAHGECASISRNPDGSWTIDPQGLAKEKDSKAR
jgi:hypothetical protein